MSLDANSEPISRLDDRVDDLLRALTATPDLAGLITGLRGYEAALALVPIGAPAAVDAIAVSAVWHAIAEVAGEVLALREEAADGRTS